VFASVAGAGALVALVVAYRRQRLAETTADLDRSRWEGTAAHDRTRLLNERFTTIAGQLGDAQVKHAGSQRVPVSPAKPVSISLVELNQECAYALRVLVDVRSREGRYDPQPGQLTAPGIAAFPGHCGERHTSLIPGGNYLGGPGAAQCHVEESVQRSGAW